MSTIAGNPEAPMGTGRIIGFSDGVIAIAITVMVLELRLPAGTNSTSLIARLPVFSSYVLSFVYLGIYWSNHHNLFHAVERVDGAVLWTNLHLLFWLTLVPFTTAWISENHFAAWPTAVYGIVLLLAGVAYYILVRTLVALHGKGSDLARALGKQSKDKLSVLLYAVAIPLAFAWPLAADALYVTVAVLWLIPDRRLEGRIAS
jgi:uncharacterized membrane protein